MRSPLRPQSRRITHPSVAPDTQLYDFRQAAQLSPDQVRMLTHQAASLAAVVSRTLQAYLDADVSLDLKSLETVGYEQYVGALPEVMVAGIIAFHAGLPPGIWEVPIPVAFAAIDCMLGGRGNAIPEDMRDLTPVQAAVLSRFLNDILSTWTVAWNDLSVISPHIERVVTSNAVAAATGRVDSQTIHMRLSVKIAAAEGVMNVALPITAMQRVLREGHLEGRHGAVPSRERIAKAPLGKHAPRFPCGVRVVLRAPKLTLRRLLSLHPGDVIDLQCPTDEPFVMIVGEHDKFAATPGVSRGLVAARIDKPLPM